MKIEVNAALCSGHARCNAAAPEIYELDDSGFCAITTLDVTPDQEAAAVRGAGACPERAITIVSS
ncbi:MAG TPA: ferredoxin [Trebonia sp.]|jgi:ferredoxin|nr:ferredoxin [Trebonia sp.]